MLRALDRLDPTIAAWTKDMRRGRVNELVSRVAVGITSHFKLRVSEWFTSAILFQFGWTLMTPPATFGISPVYAVMASWAPEAVWGWGCILVGTIRLCALTVNGTFPRFRWSPHIRCITALLACFTWFQILLGFWLTGLSTTAVGTFRLVLLLEFWNVYRAGVETGIVEGTRRYGGR